ncbi:MAG: DUF3369 domain-containing protein [Bacteroidia bacterium]|nr:DUF3369 domain-containing protein [Bacteroidia bacterium]
MTDDLLFVSELDDGAKHQRAWRILIVDDDESVHSVTKLALSGVVYKERELEFTSAYTGAQAVEILREDPNYALAFMDVVMETDSAGLDAIRSIREELGNAYIRIILRTGQPGQAPEKDVILGYDINDYKSKTELTATRLFTSVISSLRSYEDILTLARQRRGLERVIFSLASNNSARSIQDLGSGLLEQIEAMLGVESSAIYAHSFLGEGDLVESNILAATGTYESEVGESVISVVEPDFLRQISSVLREKVSYFGPQFSVVFLSTNISESFLFIRSPLLNKNKDRHLLERTLQSITLAHENAVRHAKNQGPSN